MEGLSPTGLEESMRRREGRRGGEGEGEDGGTYGQDDGDLFELEQ